MSKKITPEEQTKIILEVQAACEKIGWMAVIPPDRNPDDLAPGIFLGEAEWAMAAAEACYPGILDHHFEAYDHNGEVVNEATPEDLPNPTTKKTTLH